MFRILSLDGGGAKGFYTLGVLKEVEALIERPIYQHFQLVFGTSTGSIIAALLCLGNSVDDVRKLYEEHVPKVVSRKTPSRKSAALAELSRIVFGELGFDAFKTDIGIVATRWHDERPMIFKTSIDQAHGREGSFVPGFGCRIGDAVEASCSAFPFIKRKTVRTSTGDMVELIDGGFCANNPTLYAIADAVRALEVPRDEIRMLSVGVGEYPKPRKGPLSLTYWIDKLPPVQLLQKTLEINTQSMDQLRQVLFSDIKTVRVSQAFTKPEMATDLFEHDMDKLNLLWQRGRQSYAQVEEELKALLG